MADLPGEIILDDGSTKAVRVLVLSSMGCTVQTPAPLTAGSHVRLSIPDLGEFDGLVCRCSAGEAELSFGSPAPAPAPKALQPRENQRVSLSVDVTLRRSGRATFTVRATDLSPTGCRLDFVERPAVGERLFVKFGGLDALQAEVRWVDGFTGGVRFARPIHSAVFERLIASLR